MTETPEGTEPDLIPASEPSPDNAPAPDPGEDPAVDPLRAPTDPEWNGSSGD